MKKLLKGDEVIVTAGREKGKRGTVEKVVTRGKGAFVLIEGVNLVKKHRRPNPNNNDPGGITEKEALIQISNVMLYNPETERGDRIGIREEGSRKVRFFKSTGKVVG